MMNITHNTNNVSLCENIMEDIQIEIALFIVFDIICAQSGQSS